VPQAVNWRKGAPAFVLDHGTGNEFSGVQVTLRMSRAGASTLLGTQTGALLPRMYLQWSAHNAVPDDRRGEPRDMTPPQVIS
jgi:hypothetical protein